MNTLITTQGGIISTVIAVTAISFLVQNIKGLKIFGPVLPAILIGLLLSNTNVLPHWHDSYGMFFNYFIPIAITMFLLSVDFKEWVKMSKQPLLAIFLAAFSVCVVSFVAGLFFVPKLDEGWKIAGMLVGSYTGGTSNATAVGVALSATPNTFASVNAANYVVGTPIAIIIFLLPGILAKSKTFKKIWPYSLEEEDLISGDEEVFGKKEWSVTDIALLFALGFVVNEVAGLIAQFFNPVVAGAAKIISISTIAIIIAQFKPVKKIKGNTDLGFLLAVTFAVVIGLMIDLTAFVNTAALTAVFAFTVIISSLIVHIVLCRLFKIKYQYTLIAIMAAFADGTTSAMLAAAAKWKSLIPVAIVLGIIGMALGNYIGIGLAYTLKGILGI